tara:strand:- start:4669 stop:6069 length:1401 start_codon:yes stop_codon:yes gene_type:complete
MNFELLVLLVYSASLIALGLWIGRRVESSGEFFVANRKLGAGLIFSTVLAANIGAGSTVGAAGLGYRDGLAGWWWVGSAALGTLILAIWIGPKIWRIAAEHGLYTMGDYLELRYGQSVRVVLSGLLWLGTPALLAAQLIAMSKILEFVTGAPTWTGIFIGAVVIMAYFTTGGLLTSAWVNMVQAIFILIGFAIALPWALQAVGGWSGLVSEIPQSHDYLDFWNGGRSGWIYLAIIGPNFIVSPGLIQKVYGAVDERAIRLGLGAASLALLVFAIAPPILGMIGRVYDPNLMDHEHALMLVLRNGLPTLLGSLGLAAVFSAEISSADAILFMLSTSLSKDLYKRFINPDASDKKILMVSRSAALAGGTIAVLLALVLPSIIDALTIFYSLMAVCLFIPVVVGLYTRRPGTPEALAAIGAGIAVLIIVNIMELENSWPWLDASFLGLLASAATFGIVFLVRRGTGART